MLSEYNVSGMGMTYAHISGISVFAPNSESFLTKSNLDQLRRPGSI